MHFYGPLLVQTWPIAKDWVTSFSLGSKAAIGLVSVVVGTLVSYLRKLTPLSHILWGVVTFILGIVAFVVVIFLTTLLYYAPSAVLESTAGKAKSDAISEQTVNCYQRIARYEQRVDAVLDAVEQSGYPDNISKRIADEQETLARVSANRAGAETMWNNWRASHPNQSNPGYFYPWMASKWQERDARQALEATVSGEKIQLESVRHASPLP